MAGDAALTSSQSSALGDWRDVDRKLRRIAKRRAALDHEELRLIRRAIALAIWRELGMTSIREYLEDVFGYGPVVASERVRVAEALGALPALEQALVTSALSYSAVREISRIATRKTEGAWVDACRGKNLRQIEELLAEREPGDRPESPRNPDLRMRELRFKVRPATEAAVRVARQRLEAECGERLDEDELLKALTHCVLSGGGLAPRAATQIAITMCRACGIARQTAAGRDIALRPEEFECALCDAEWIDVNGKKRARQDVTLAVRKAVKLRDGGRCRVPGCRATKHLDLHHIVPRWYGGSHDPENLILLCSGHHAAHHRLELRITGTGSNPVFEWTTRPVSDDSASDGDFHVENVAGGADDAVDGDFHVESPVCTDDSRRSDFHVESNDACAGDALDRNFHVESRASAASGACDAPDSEFHVKSRPEVEQWRADAMLALRTLGFTHSEVVAAVEGALKQGTPRSLEDLLRAALRRCPRPTH